MAASSDLVTYLGGLANGTMLVGVSDDEVTWHLTSGAVDVLAGLGVNVSTLMYRGKLAFYAEKGDPGEAITEIKAMGGTSLVYSTVLNGAF